MQNDLSHLKSSLIRHDTSTTCYWKMAPTHPHQMKDRVLFLNGAQSASFVWQPIIPFLESEKMMCYFYDFFGRGGSTTEKNDLGLEDYNNQLDQLISRGMDGQVDYIVALSWGGVVLSQYFLKKKLPLKGVILICPGGLWGPSIVETLFVKNKFVRKRLMKKDPSFFIKREMKKCFFSDIPEGFLKNYYNQVAVNSNFMRSVISSLCSYPLMNRKYYLNLISHVPKALVLWASHDRKISTYFSKKMLAGPNVTHQCLDKSGHLLTWEQSKKVAELLVNFVGENKIVRA